MRIKKIFAYKKTQNSQLTINNFPPFRVGEKKIVSVKVALSIGAVVLHKTQCLRFLIRENKSETYHSGRSTAQ